MQRKPLLLIALMLLSVLQGCAALVVGTGVGVAASAHDRRTLGTQIDDKTLSSRLSIKLNENEALKEHTHINTHVYNGVALLVGQSPNDDLKRQAQQAAESVDNIKKLYNQVRIGSPTALSTRTNDVWLASKIKTALLTDKRVDGLHIKVVVEDSEVFLMGLVSNQEADVAVEIARNISGVIKVVKAFEYV